MTRGKKVLLMFVLVAVAFLSGLILGYTQLRQTREALQTAQNERDALRLQNRLSQVRDLAALMYFETSRQNYGLASEYATRYFDQVKSLSNAELPAEMHPSVSQLLSHRDAVVDSLAKAEPGAIQQVQALFLDTYHRTQLEDAGHVSARPE